MLGEKTKGPVLGGTGPGSSCECLNGQSENSADSCAGQASNRLPDLAAEIRRAHADVQDAAKTAAERAIAAGHMLIEARDLVQHGQWLPWLREHCALAERTAQLYMAIARKGIKSAIVADLGLQAAAKALTLTYGHYRPAYDGDAASCREWRLFALFLRTKCGFPVWGASDHIDWIGRHNFITVDEWLGPEGQKFVSPWGNVIPESTVSAWQQFRDGNKALTVSDIDSELERLAGIEKPTPRRKLRRRAS